MFLSKESVSNLAEDPLCQDVLIPLLRAMGFRDVTYTHGGSGEQGKDIVCWKEDELSSRRNYALVVKAVKVTGKAKVAKGTTGEIATQIQQCFGKPYLDPITTEPELVHQCWVVSNKEIGKEAEEAIRSSLTSIGLDRNVQFIDMERLWLFIEKYLPFSTILSKLENVGKSLGEMDTHYQPRVTLEPNSNIHMELVEKFPGAAKEKPLEFSTVFQFPPTPDGKAARQAFENSYETGEPADIPLQYLQSVELPDFLNSLVSVETLQKGMLHIGEVATSPHIYAKIKIECDDGDAAGIDYVDLAVKKLGRQKVTLENQDPEDPFHVQIEIEPNKNFARFKITPRSSETMNVFQLYQIIHLLYCFTKPCVLYILNRENGFPIFSHRTDGVGLPIQPEALIELEDLIKIQNKIKKPINFPSRELTKGEIKSIAHLRAIYHKPRLTKKWEYLDAELSIEGISSFLETLEVKNDLFFRVTQVEQEELFGVEIPLGEVQLLYRHAKIDNLGDVISRMGAITGENSIEIHLVPNGPDSLVEIEYLDWSKDDQPDNNAK